MGEVVPSDKGQQLMRSYEATVERHRRAEQEIRSSRVDLSNATNELGRWLVPKDAKVGEKFGVWGRDHVGMEALFEVTVPDPSQPEYVVRIRRRS